MATNEEGQEEFRTFVAEAVRRRAQNIGFNASRLAKAFGISSSSASNYWRGERAWPIELLPFVAGALHTTVGELVSFEDVVSTQLPEGVLSAGSTFVATSRPDEVAIPILELGYGMGGTFVDDAEDGVEVANFPSAFIRKFTQTPAHLLAWADGIGDSMYPTIGDRDLLLIDRSKDTIAMNDQVWALVSGGIGMVKRVRMNSGQVHLMSDNPNVSDYTAGEDELSVIGRVVAVVRRI